MNHQTTSNFLARKNSKEFLFVDESNGRRRTSKTAKWNKRLTVIRPTKGPWLLKEAILRPCSVFHSFKTKSSRRDLSNFQLPRIPTLRDSCVLLCHVKQSNGWDLKNWDQYRYRWISIIRYFGSVDKSTNESKFQFFWSYYIGNNYRLTILSRILNIFEIIKISRMEVNIKISI